MAILFHIAPPKKKKGKEKKNQEMLFHEYLSLGWISNLAVVLP